jgi:hypothetical protein
MASSDPSSDEETSSKTRDGENVVDLMGADAGPSEVNASESNSGSSGGGSDVEEHESDGEVEEVAAPLDAMALKILTGSTQLKKNGKQKLKNDESPNYIASSTNVDNLPLFFSESAAGSCCD